MRIKIAILFFAGAITCSAQETEVPLRDYTLRQCIDYAISHNITVRQSANNVVQSAVDISTAKWARLPNLNGSAGQNWRWGRNSVTETDKMETNIKFIRTHIIMEPMHLFRLKFRFSQVLSYPINMR